MTQPQEFILVLLDTQGFFAYVIADSFHAQMQHFRPKGSYVMGWCDEMTPYYKLLVRLTSPESEEEGGRERERRKLCKYLSAFISSILITTGGLTSTSKCVV